MPVGSKQDLAGTQSGRGGRSLGTISLGRDNYGSENWRSNFAGLYQPGWPGEWARDVVMAKVWMAASAEGGVGRVRVRVLSRVGDEAEQDYTPPETNANKTGTRMRSGRERGRARRDVACGVVVGGGRGRVSTQILLGTADEIKYRFRNVEPIQPKSRGSHTHYGSRDTHRHAQDRKPTPCPP